MPIIITSTLPSKGSLGGGIGGGGMGTPFVHLDPIQIMGFVQMKDCAATECRVRNPFNCCYRNPVFGNVVSGKAITTATYENDFNWFAVDVSVYSANAAATTATWYLQKCSSDIGGIENWTTVATLNNNNYGKLQTLNSITGHSTYTSYLINWGLVLQLQGAGIYRIKISTSMRSLVGCLISDEFWLRAWDCNLADGTIKFEATNTGKKGNPFVQGAIFDICGMQVYDSIRVRGYFGKEIIANYLEVINEYQNGQIDRIRDEAIQEWDCKTGMLPKAYHDRLKVYAMMANTLLVSDYNICNSDYNIKQIQVAKKGNYQPKYYDDKHNERQMVELKFMAGKQQIISSICCDKSVLI